MRQIILVVMLIFLSYSKSYAQVQFEGFVLDTNLEAVLTMDNITSEDGLLYIINYDSEFEVNILTMSVINKKMLKLN